MITNREAHHIHLALISPQITNRIETPLAFPSPVHSDRGAQKGQGRTQHHSDHRADDEETAGRPRHGRHRRTGRQSAGRCDAGAAAVRYAGPEETVGTASRGRPPSATTRRRCAEHRRRQSAGVSRLGIRAATLDSEWCSKQLASNTSSAA